MHLPNQRLRKPDKLSQGTHSQTSYPKVQWENTLDKRAREEREAVEKEETREQREGSRGEHRVIEQEQEHMEYPHCRKLGEITNKGIIIRMTSLL